MNSGRKASLIVLIGFLGFASPVICYAGETQKGWYESAVQVFIGGLLVFLSTEGHNFFEIKRTKKSLKAGIK